MASGFGLHGGISRCHVFWQDFLACYIVNTADGDEDGKWKCVPQRNDYYECLYHQGEADKMRAITAAYRRRLETGGELKPKVPATGNPGEAYILGVLGKKPGTDYKPGYGPLRADGTQ